MLNESFSMNNQSSFSKMTIVDRLTFLAVFWASVLVTYCNGQVKTNLPAENTTISTGQPKLIKTQGSGSGNNVHSILQDKKGNLWFGTTGEGVYRYDGTSFTNYTTRDGLNSNSTFAILEDIKGNFWIGTSSGLSHYDARLNDEVGQGKSFTHIPLSFTEGSYPYPSTSANTKTSGNNAVTRLLQDKTGKLWVGTDNGVYCYDGKAFTRFLDNPGIINSNGLAIRLVTNMLEDKQGHIWFATKMEGIVRFDGKTLINYTPNNELWFRGLLEDKNGNIWAGTRYQGVYLYNGKIFSKFLQNGKFDTYTVVAITQDNSGKIWFGTEAGEESKRESEGGVWVFDGISFKNFSIDDGLSRVGITSAFEDKSGNLWFGTRYTGLYRYDGKTFTSFSE
jgi:ligand-binding sensor domain-containing protein